MKFLDWLSKIGEYLTILSETLRIISEFLANVALRFPDLVQFLYEGVWEIFALKDSLISAGYTEDEVSDKVNERSDELVISTQNKFHGSGSQISTQFIKQIIEGIVALGKAERYGVSSFENRDVKARDLGYLVSPDLERAKKAYPQLFGVR